MTPTRSYGPWPFVVVSIPKNNAVQIQAFDTTLARVSAALPGSYRLQSTRTGAVHIYVNAPNLYSYGQGALLLRAFFADQRWLAAGPNRGRSVLAELVSVASEPLVLPFGLGWEQMGGRGSLEAQLDAFIALLGSRDTTDFTRAERHVEQYFDVAPRWTVDDRGDPEKSDRHELRQS
jgi:hypothetical protein